MKVVGICGILDFGFKNDRLWKNFEESFRNDIPTCSFTVERCFYLPWQFEKIKNFEKGILNKYKDSTEDIIFFGYSFGGIIACDLYHLMKDKVKVVVTFGTPHLLSFLFNKVNLSKQKFNPKEIPVIDMYGILDVFIPWFTARDKFAFEQIGITTDHIFFVFFPIFSKKIARRITSEVKYSILD